MTENNADLSQPNQPRRPSPAASITGKQLLTGFVRLMLGHFSRFRTPQLQAVAVEWTANPTPAKNALLWLTNSSIAVRAVFMRGYLIARRAYSRATFHSDRQQLPHRVKSLLCPSRGRPVEVARFVSSVARTARRPECVEILIYVDEDDKSVTDYRRQIARLQSRFPLLKRLDLTVGPALGVSRAWNAMAASCSGELLIMANDDQMYADYGWDEALDLHVDRQPDGVFALFFDDGQYLPGTTDFPIVSRAWYACLGYYCPEHFNFWFNEAWIFDIADRLGRIASIPGIFVQHFHYQNYTAMFDDTYQLHRIDSGKSLQDREVWEQTAANRIAAAKKLEQIMRSGA